MYKTRGTIPPLITLELKLALHQTEQRQRVKMKLAASHSTSSGTSRRLKAERTEVILVRNLTFWCLPLKGNSFHMPHVR